MTRLGMNPGRGKASSFSPARVTAAVLVHIPHFSGYFEHRFPVLKLCLSSLVENTLIPLDLMIFDNGSCVEVGDYLRELQHEGVIQFLVGSRSNLGKIGALQILVRAAPGEVVAYCDDDFFFFPGWLEAQLEILDIFPNAGMVSGYAIPSLFIPERISSTLEFARRADGAELLEGKYIPQEWIQDWALSTGRDPLQELESAARTVEYIIEYAGQSVFASANHDQFIARKAIIQECLPRGWSGNLMGQMLELDEAVNRAGFLRLTTRERTAQHLGNRLSEQIMQNLPAQTAGLNVSPPRRARSPRWWRRLLSWGPVRTLLLGLYSKLFHLINPE